MYIYLLTKDNALSKMPLSLIKLFNFFLPVTVTWNVHVASFPAWSLKMYDTWVWPIPKAELGACENTVEMSLTGVTLSVAVGSCHVTTADVWPTCTACVISDGQLEIVGGMVSPCTV